MNPTEKAYDELTGEILDAEAELEWRLENKAAGSRVQDEEIMGLRLQIAMMEADLELLKGAM